ncbi:MAG: DUF5615 family PIN-like protein [Blastocatellia bacterium]
MAWLADREDRVVVTKDSDFLKLHILQNQPAKLLLITTGNIANKELFLLFEQNLETIMHLFETYDVVELNNTFIIGHVPSPGGKGDGDEDKAREP